MFVIRKFVGYTGTAAGIGAAIALAMTSHTGLAAAPANSVDQPATSQLTFSAACTDAINAIKSAVRADASEDNSERMAARANPTAAEDPSEDPSERANLQGLFTTARTACAPAVASETSEPKAKVFTQSAACTAAIQALKGAWMQGRPTTQAQWQNLNTLGLAARSACGWSWSSAGRPPTP